MGITQPVGWTKDTDADVAESPADRAAKAERGKREDPGVNVNILLVFPRKRGVLSEKWLKN